MRERAANKPRDPLEQTKPEISRVRGSDGRFKGPRRDVESVPRLPTFPLRWVLDDRRRRPYFVFWTSDDGDLQYGLKMAPTDHGDAVLVALESGETYRFRLCAARCREGVAWPSSIDAPGAGNRAGTCTS